jgi:hypothetical protein
MSESTSEDFSDSGSDGNEEQEVAETSAKLPENKRKLKVDSKQRDESSDSSDSDDDEKSPEPVKKRKTLQDYLIEKVK